jgi:heat shock protein HslJ
MRPTPALIMSVLLLGGCANPVPPTTPAGATKSTAQLLNTYWKLTQLGELVITTPAGAREMHFVMHSENQRVTGFTGCNQMMGAYVLDGSELRFERMGGTMMACVSDMELEPRFLGMFGQVAGWEIQGETLQLLDANHKPLATFESRYLE